MGSISVCVSVSKTKGLSFKNLKAILKSALTHTTDLHGFSSVQFSCSVVSDSLRPHELQHAGPPCPSPTPGVRVHQVSDAIQPSHPLLSPSPLAPNPSQDQSLFQ